MHFITLFEATQNGDRILFIGLLYQDFLEATLKRRVFLNMLAVLVQCGRTDAMKLTPSKRRLQHVARIHGTLSLACAHHGMQFINEQDNSTLFLGERFEYRLQPFLKITPKFGAGQ